MKLKELLDDKYNILNPEEIKTSKDELDNYIKKADPADEEKPVKDINMPDIGENKMGIKLSKLMESESKRLSQAEIKEVLESIKRFNEYGSKIYRTDEINDMVEAIQAMCEKAGNLAIQETADWFDVVTVKNDVKGIGSAVDSFRKTAKEISTLQQRLESVYEDIGHKLGKYYEISESEAQEKHQKKFKAALDDAGVDSPAELDDEEKKDFFNKIDKGTKAKDEGINESFGFRGIATGRPNSGKVRFDGWKRITEKEAYKKDDVDEAAPKMRKNPEAENIERLHKAVKAARKGGGSGRYGKEFEKAKNKALKAIAEMETFARIGG